MRRAPAAGPLTIQRELDGGSLAPENQVATDIDAAKLELSVTLGFDPKDTTYPGLKQGVQVLNLKR